jgi:diaminohydroxyphosphoribosylaminopyrimidine deaminase/5-amino-6-(5-phosphoribosylamino)uracil reductase
MAAALALAARSLGSVHPNPAVGCILVRDDGPSGEGRVVGRGWTQASGRPHAETEALRRAGAQAKGATAYVTLEPCAHFGETPPCADALVAAGISRAVIAIEDPDPRVAGRGIAKLREAGIEVTTGVMAAEARELNAGFLMRIGQGRPLVTWKVASTLDGRIATHRGDSQWITGETARNMAHGLRATHDAVMVGVGTVLADDPALTCRLPGLSDRSPIRIVVDGRLHLPLTSQLVMTARLIPTWVVTLQGNDERRRDAFTACGIEVIEVPDGAEGSLDLPKTLQRLGERGITRLLLEGGSRVAGGFLRAGLIDRIAWFRAPRLIGGDGVPAASAIGVDLLFDTPVFARSGVTEAGSDLLETYVRKP